MADAGLILRKKARTTKTMVSLYDTAEIGLDDDNGRYPYTLVCEYHNTNVPVGVSKTYAKALLSHPEEWCAACGALL